MQAYTACYPLPGMLLASLSRSVWKQSYPLKVRSNKRPRAYAYKVKPDLKHVQDGYCLLCNRGRLTYKSVYCVNNSPFICSILFFSLPVRCELTACKEEKNGSLDKPRLNLQACKAKVV